MSPISHFAALLIETATGRILVCGHRAGRERSIAEKMGKSVIAAQMYTVREFTQTPEDIASSLKKVRAIGYESVQLSGLGPIDSLELKKMLDGEGLSVCATHTSFDRMKDDIQAVIDYHHLLGCKYPAIGSMPGEYRHAGSYAEFVSDAAAVGERLLAAGLMFAYHNHSFELERVGGRTILEMIYADSDPRFVKAEIDTYWIQHGGGDPAAWIGRLEGRVPLVHLKDMTVVDKQPVMAEVGEGNLNWPAIIDACRKSGVEWYLVEQDICRRDPFESLAISFRNLKEMGVE